jgi:uncharacterized alkaline shock family protein YloU
MQEEDKKLKNNKNKEVESVVETKNTKPKKETKGNIQQHVATKENNAKNNLGDIKIASEVLATVVSRIVINIQGVAGLIAHSKGGFGTLLGVKEIEEGIKIDLIDDKNISAYISVIVEYGTVIIDLAKKIQSVVKNELENNTGLNVKSIDVNIMGIQMAKKNSKLTKTN